MRKLLRSFFIVVLLGFFTVASAFAPQMRIGKYLILAEDLRAKKDYGSAFRVMQKIIALKKEYSFTLSDEFHFKYARVALSVDSTRIALESVNKYLSATGEEGQFYKEALALLREAEKAEETELRAEETGNEISTDSGDRFDNEIIRTEGTCEGKPLESPCWMALINHPKCYVWNDNLRAGEIMTWSGKCSDGFAQGKGTLIATALLYYGYGDSYRNKGEGTGHFQNGKRQGHWVERPFDEVVKEGTYVNGKRHGQWVYRYPNFFRVQEEKGPYVDGRRHGKWIERSVNGRIGGGFYMDGKKHGKWVEPGRWGQSDGTYVNGKRHGKWIERNSNYTAEGPYVDDEMHGQWVLRFSDGDQSKGVYRYGKREGIWLLYDNDEDKCYSIPYQAGSWGKKKEVNKKMCQ